jgi:hypothetical protein
MSNAFTTIARTRTTTSLVAKFRSRRQKQVVTMPAKHPKKEDAA